MDGKQILELKKQYDAIAYIPYGDPGPLSKRIYYRAPTVYEFVDATASEVSEQNRHDIIQSCILTVTDSTGDKEIDNIEDFLEKLFKNAGFLRVFFQKLLELSPLADQNTAIEIYKQAHRNQKLLINTVKMDLLVAFRDVNLLKEIENVGFKKFIEYVAMLEEYRATQGMFMSELVGDDSLMEPEVRKRLEELKVVEQKAQKKQQRPNFPANIQNIDPRMADPSVRSAVMAAQNALQAKIAEDSNNLRAGKKSHINFDKENAAVGEI